jgi:hypothetical protein
MRALWHLLLPLALSSACVVRGPVPLFMVRPAPLFVAVAGTAVLTAAVVSAAAPPPPRVVYVPEARPGYSWQPGYWTLADGRWLWVEGGWVALQPGYAWAPAHWERAPDGNWQLIPGRWLARTE